MFMLFRNSLNLFLLLLIFVLSGCGFDNNITKTSAVYDAKRNVEVSEIKVGKNISTDSGDIFGYKTEKLHVFLGVPYAQAPLGDLRWKPPVAVRYGARKNCTKYGYGDVYKSKEYLVEDALYLNIWTPAKKESQKLPVLVWFTEESFSGDNPASQKLDATFFATNHNVIVVTVSSRLGVFGFLNSSAFAKNLKNQSGNFNFLDKKFALKWLRRNIVRFGGDPQNLTVGGCKAGAIAVLALLQDKASEKLFKKAIVASGSIDSLMYESSYKYINLRKSLSNATKLSEFLQINSKADSAINDLRKIKAELIVRAAEKLVNKNVNFVPYFDGIILKERYKESVAGSDYRDISLLIGFDVNASLNDETNKFSNLNEYYSWCYDIFGDNAKKLLRNYRAKSLAVARQNKKHILNQAAYAAPIEIIAKDLSQKGQNVFVYNFDHLTPDPLAMTKYSSSEIAYFFANLPATVSANDEDKELAMLIGNLWSNFIKSGNPNLPETGKYNLFWPAYKDSSDKIFIFDRKSSYRQNPYNGTSEIIRNF